MKQFINKVKYRWNVAPLWVKALDITCWVLLIMGVLWFTR